MIQLTASTKILVATEPVDMRNGIDGLSAMCRKSFGQDPMSGTVFVFVNRLRTQLRLLYYDGQGFWLCTKRLSSGRYKYWPSSSSLVHLVAEQLFVLLRAGDPSTISTPENWRSIS